MHSFQNIFFLLLFLLSVCFPGSGVSQQETTEAQADGQETAPTGGFGSTKPFDADFDNSPTYVRSNTLLLRSDKREITYSGNVEVLHKGMRLTCDELVAFYSEQNEIEKIVAQNNVFIEKGKEIQARSEKAVYEQASETVTLTENPELVQEGSVLSADLIRVFLNEDRSVAEGAVRVKLLQKDDSKDKTLARQPDKDPLRGALTR